MMVLFLYAERSANPVLGNGTIFGSPKMVDGEVTVNRSVCILHPLLWYVEHNSRHYKNLNNYLYAVGFLSYVLRMNAFIMVSRSPPVVLVLMRVP